MIQELLAHAEKLSDVYEVGNKQSGRREAATF